MTEDVTRLLDEYVARIARGEQPDLGEYLDRAGDGRDELASLADAWLQRVEPPPPDEESVELMRSWLAGEPPLVTLRARRGLRRAEIVDRIIERFSLDARKREKVERYYHQVETGQLRPSPSIREALEAFLGQTGLTWRVRPLPAAEPAYFRADAPLRAPDAMGLRPVVAEPWDEIDELFRGEA